MQTPNNPPNEPFIVTEHMRRQIAGAIAELDPKQLSEFPRVRSLILQSGG